MKNACGHEAPAATSRMCVHLGFTPTKQGNGQLAALENGELITWRR
jgi:hypothetical protein